MKKNIVRISSLVLLAAMLFSFASCASSTGETQVLNISMIYDENSPYKPGSGTGTVGGNVSTGGQSSGGQSTGGGSAATPDNGGGTAQTPSGDAQTPSGDAQTPSGDAQTPSGDASGDGGAAATGPSTPAEILTKFTEVTNDMKTNLKQVTKLEYQVVENLDLAGIETVVQPLIGQFVKGKDAATPKTDAGPGDIPPWGNSGCLVTDASKVQNATYTDNGDGTATIVLTLVAEKNPEPATDGVSPSITGGIFSPLKKADIDKTLADLPINVESFDLDYHDCTATITFNTSNNQVTSYTQVMNVDIVATIKVLMPVTGSGTLINTIEFSNFAY